MKSHRKIENIYVAASTAETERAQTWTNRLALAGLNVVSTWLKTVSEVGVGNPRDASLEQRRQWSNADLGEIRACDLLWFLVPPPDVCTRGAWLEVGFADACDKVLVFSGDTKQSIFTSLGDEWAEDVEAFALICRLARLGACR